MTTVKTVKVITYNNADDVVRPYKQVTQLFPDRDDVFTFKCLDGYKDDPASDTMTVVIRVEDVYIDAINERRGLLEKPENRNEILRFVDSYVPSIQAPGMFAQKKFLALYADLGNAGMVASLETKREAQLRAKAEKNMQDNQRREAEHNAQAAKEKEREAAELTKAIDQYIAGDVITWEQAQMILKAKGVTLHPRTVGAYNACSYINVCKGQTGNYRARKGKTVNFMPLWDALEKALPEA